MIHTPRFLTITEANPTSISQFHVIAKSQDNLTDLAGGNYPIQGGTTVIPIGSNGFFDPVADGTFVNLFVTEVAAPGYGDNGPEQQVPGGPFQVLVLADGAEELTVTL